VKTYLDCLTNKVLKTARVAINLVFNCLLIEEELCHVKEVKTSFCSRPQQKDTEFKED